MIDTLLAHLERFDVERMRTALASPGAMRWRPCIARRTSTIRDRPPGSWHAAGRPRLLPVVLPLHPRGRPTLDEAGLRADERLRVIDPLGYLDFLSLVRGPPWS